jgi:predicted kinase
MKLLTVMCGVPGAGKSTWVNAQCSDAVHLSADIVRRNPRRRMMSQIGGMKVLAPDILRQGKHVVIDACSTKLQDRHDWLHVARVAHAPTRLVVVQTDLDTCLMRQHERGKQGVPAAIVTSHYEKLMESLPLFDSEGWAKIIRVSGLPVGQPGGDRVHLSSVDRG